MNVIWGKSVTVPDFSIQCQEKWFILKAIFETFKNSHIGWNRIEIQKAHTADTPDEADHAIIEGKSGIMKHALSSIDFPAPYVIKSIEIYKFTLAHSESESGIIEYDGCLIFNFDDGRRFAISSYQAPSGTLGFTMDEADINQLDSLSSQKMFIT